MGTDVSISGPAGHAPDTAAWAAAAGPAPRSIGDIPGWFGLTDQRLMDWLLEHQRRQEIRGDLVELGAYLGKSAVLIGRHLAEGEHFTVCDLFDSPAPDEANAAEVRRSYRGLVRATFERNYRAFHSELPAIVEAPTSAILRHVEPGSCRFVHVDASHQYRHVHLDVSAARTMLRPGGVVVFDDYRSAHTPGVAAAVWEAVLTGGLRPLWLSPSKLYGTWDDPTALQASMVSWLREVAGPGGGRQDVAGHMIVLVGDWKKPPPGPARPAKALPPPTTPTHAAGHPLLVDLLPPMLARFLRRARDRVRALRPFMSSRGPRR